MTKRIYFRFHAADMKLLDALGKKRGEARGATIARLAQAHLSTDRGLVLPSVTRSNVTPRADTNVIVEDSVAALLKSTARRYAVSVTKIIETLVRREAGR